MDLESQILRRKALLLINRERELVTLRSKHQRLLKWLSLSQSLPEVLHRGLSCAEIGAELVHRIMTLTKLQRVHLLELRADGMRPFGTDHATMPPLPVVASDQISVAKYGAQDRPVSNAEQALAQSLSLHRLVWYRLDVLPDAPVLLVGGFDEVRAASYLPFDQEDVEHFVHAGQHFESLLRNMLLVNELERDKTRLEQFNDVLEQRVQERTEALARSNQDVFLTLASLRDREQRLSDDLAQARTFQQSILPTLPEGGFVEFGAVYRPLDMVGGDVYDVAEIRTNHYRVFLADATGHGVQASLRTIAIKSEYDQLKFSHESLDSLFVELNRRLVAKYTQQELLCTASCFDILIDPRITRLRYMNAAQPPLLCWCGTEVKEYYHDGPFLGLSVPIALRVEEVDLCPEALVVAYTDGICDQPGPGAGPFEMRAVLLDHVAGASTLTSALEGLFDEFERFRGAVPRRDDVTIVAMRVAGHGHCR